MKRIAAVIGLSLFVLATQARADDEPTLGDLVTEYDQHPNERETIGNIFLWVQDGFLTANSDLEEARHETRSTVSRTNSLSPARNSSPSRGAR